MCGRFSLETNTAAVARYFCLPRQLPLEPRWNIAPGQDILAVRVDSRDGRVPVMLHWGLIPPWAKDKAAGYRMINARAETVAEKSSFKAAYRARRCLIPADGFYEWKKTATGKQPYHVRKADSGLFAFAGIWESWADQQTKEVIESCSILTTAANDLLKPLHDRMPVVLAEEDFDPWLHADPQNLGPLLRPRHWQGFELIPVSAYVNNARNEGARCIEPVG
jgi:putative SOS response-associated peptidase YedK